ncbi:MAG: ATP-dependent protease, partial [Nitrospinota bacterium]
MSPVQPLSAEALYRRCDPAQFSFETTSELDNLQGIVGQPRAVEAIQFGTGMRREGYHLFALGPAGTGKYSLVHQFLTQRAGSEPVPPDWCYVNNFEQPHKPRALQLPAGQGTVLRHDIDRLVEELRTAIPAAFESEDYRTRRQVIEEEFKERQEQALEELRKQAQERGIALMRTPMGLAFAPMREEKVLGPEEFQKLPPEERKRIETEVSMLQDQLQSIVRQVPRWERESREKLRQLNREVTIFAVGHLIEELRQKYTSFPAVLEYLQALEQDVLNNIQDFLKPAETPPELALGSAQSPPPGDSGAFRRYRVNVLVDHSQTQGAPVVYEDHPTYQSLVGRIEHIAQMGALVTDFNLIKAGALHRANGGYLILDAYKVLMQPYAWEGLKRALRAREIRIESLGQMLSLVTTVSLEPEPIPLQVKVVLLGERLLYCLLAQFDAEFNELFKVAVDFEEEMDRSPENQHLYARLLATLIRKEGLRPFDRSGVARVIEQSARMVSDAEKLSLHMRSVVDLLREADYWAGEAGRDVVSAADVQRAIDAQIHR